MRFEGTVEHSLAEVFGAPFWVEAGTSALWSGVRVVDMVLGCQEESFGPLDPGR